MKITLPKLNLFFQSVTHDFPPAFVEKDFCSAVQNGSTHLQKSVGRRAAAHSECPHALAICIPLTPPMHSPPLTLASAQGCALSSTVPVTDDLSALVSTDSKWNHGAPVFPPFEFYFSFSGLGFTAFPEILWVGGGRG